CGQATLPTPMTWVNPDDWLTRLLFQRALALVFLIAFLNAANQFRPLLGEHGLLPVHLYIKDTSFRETPSLFLLSPQDWTFAAEGWGGVVLSVIALTGIAERFATPVSMLVWALMWLLYLSFVNVGQTFYGFGWESILLEAGFYAIFLGSRNTQVQTITIW